MLATKLLYHRIAQIYVHTWTDGIIHSHIAQRSPSPQAGTLCPTRWHVVMHLMQMPWSSDRVLRPYLNSRPRTKVTICSSASLHSARKLRRATSRLISQAKGPTGCHVTLMRAIVPPFAGSNVSVRSVRRSGDNLRLPTTSLTVLQVILFGGTHSVTTRSTAERLLGNSICNFSRWPTWALPGGCARTFSACGIHLTSESPSETISQTRSGSVGINLSSLVCMGGYLSVVFYMCMARLSTPAVFSILRGVQPCRQGCQEHSGQFQAVPKCPSLLRRP